MAKVESTISLKDKFTSVLKRIDQQMNRTGNNMDKMSEKTTRSARAFDKIANIVKNSMNKATSTFNAALSRMPSNVQSSTLRILQLFGNLGNGVSRALKGATSVTLSVTKNLANGVARGFNATANAVKAGVGRIGTFLKESGGHFKQYGSDMKNAFDKTKSGAQGTSSVFKSVLGAMGVVKLAGATTNGIKMMTSELSASSATWQTFEGNMKMFGKTDKQITSVKGELQKFAQETIYSASDMASTYSQLAAVGVKNTTQLVKGFGGLASASEDPGQAMKTLSQQATQMAAKPKVMWEDFKLVMEQTPAGIAAIAKTMKKSTTGLVSDVQNGKIKTEEFFDAITKTGTNKGFTKMATEFKTVGQAMDGLTEGLTNKLQPVFDKVSKFGIKHVSKLADKIESIDFEKKINNMVSKIKPYMKVLKSAFDEVKKPLGEAFDAIDASMDKIGGSFGSKDSVKGFQGFVDVVVNNVKRLAEFAKTNAEPIAKLIKVLPKLAASIVGFKIGKAVLSPMASFTKGILGMAKATGKLGKNMGGSFFKMFKKNKKIPKMPNMPTPNMPKGGDDMPEMPKIGPFDAGLNNLLKTANTAGKAAIAVGTVYAAVKIIRELAQAMQDIQTKVSTDFKGLGMKMLAMGVALTSMGAVVAGAGSLANAFKGQALMGLAMVVGLSVNLMLAAEALKQIDNKVPDDLGNVARKMGAIALALGAMGLIVAAVGVLVSSGIGALIGGVGLLGVAALAGELITVSEAMNKLNSVSDDTKGLKKKLNSMKNILQAVADMNLGGFVDIFKNLFGNLNTSILTGALDKFASMGDSLKALEKVEFDGEKVTGVVKKLQETMEVLKTDGGFWSKLGDWFGSKVDNSAVTVATETFANLVQMATDIGALQYVRFNGDAVIVKVGKINEVISAIGKPGKSSLRDVIGGVLKLGDVNTAVSNVKALRRLAEALQALGGSEGEIGNASGLVGTMQTAMSGLKTATVNGLNGIETIIKGGVTKITSAFSPLKTSLFVIGTFAMLGFASGIRSAGAVAVAEAESVANRVSLAMKSALDEHSPSKVTHEIGEFAGLGLANGLEEMANRVELAGTNLGRAAIPENLGETEVHVNDSDVAKLKASANQQVIVKNKQVTPQVNVYVDKEIGNDVDEDKIAEAVARKIVKAVEEDMS